jgi:lipoprotein NlpD
MTPRTLTRTMLAPALCAALAGCAGLGSWDHPRGWNDKVELPEPKPSRPLKENEHLVHSGDTVYSIAFRNNLDYRELARWNEIGKDYLIYPGQILRLTAPPPPPMPKVQTDEIESEGMDMSHETEKARPITGDSPPPVETATITPMPGEIVEPAGFAWTWPTNGTVSRGYAPGEGAKGLDFTGSIGQPVFAAAPGRVVYSGNALKGYGELIIIKHDDVHLSAYGYNRKRYVDEGDVVTVGQVIGEMGLGPENKPLLHFEIRERGRPTDPAALLPARGATKRASN